MRKIMVFQHVGHEPLGTLDPLLKAAGFRIRYINFGRDPFLEPDMESYNGLIVLGGPMGVYEANQYPHLLWEMKQIEKAFKKNIPVLGICLGAQLIAHVLGSQVRKAPRWELGWTPLELTSEGSTDNLFSHYKKTEKIFQIHQDTFDIPKSTVHLAKSELCSGQAFRYNDNVYALQFHLEVDEPMITRWMKRQENHDIVYNSHGMFNLPDITSDTVAHMPRNLELSEHTFKKFIELFGLAERVPALRSR